MKHQPGPMVAQAAVPAPADVARPAGNDPLAWYDQIRALLIQTGLPPEPAVYDVLWRYVRDEDAELSLAIDKAMAGDGLTLGAVISLRETLLGQMSEGPGKPADRASPWPGRGPDQATRKRADRSGRLWPRHCRWRRAFGRTDGCHGAGHPAGTVERRNLDRAGRQWPPAGGAGAGGRRRPGAGRSPNPGRAGRPLALAVVDVDHFKRFNDRFGHAMGDDVLRFVASHLAERLETDGGFVGRLGGEEFVGVMPATMVQAAAGRIDRIRADLAGQVLRSAVDGSSMGRISFSAGVAEHRAWQAPDQLIERADGALYTAKRLGRDRAVPDRG